MFGQRFTKQGWTKACLKWLLQIKKSNFYNEKPNKYISTSKKPLKDLIKRDIS